MKKAVIKEKAVKLKNHVIRVWPVYAGVTVAGATVALWLHNNREWYKFLEAEGIDPMKFFNPEYYAELNSK